MKPVKVKDVTYRKLRIDNFSGIWIKIDRSLPKGSVHFKTAKCLITVRSVEKQEPRYLERNK